MINYLGLEHALRYAIDAGMQSPCMSKRGVVLYSSMGSLLAATCNDQPAPSRCTGDERCKQNCGKTAVHAEQAAIARAGLDAYRGSMLHVKVKDGDPCASRVPSCLECSKLILAAGIDWMHLIQEPEQDLAGAENIGCVFGWDLQGKKRLLQNSSIDISFEMLDAVDYDGTEPPTIRPPYSTMLTAISKLPTEQKQRHISATAMTLKNLSRSVDGGRACLLKSGEKRFRTLSNN